MGLRTTTGTRDVRVVFPNHERALLPGQFVRVRFVGAVRTGVFLVPQRAVQVGPEGPTVYIVGGDDKAELRRIQGAGWEGDRWLVEGGLRAGERVVIDGLQKLSPGIAVKPLVTADTAAGTQPAEAKTGAIP